MFFFLWKRDDMRPVVNILRLFINFSVLRAGYRKADIIACHPTFAQQVSSFFQELKEEEDKNSSWTFRTRTKTAAQSVILFLTVSHFRCFRSNDDDDQIVIVGCVNEQHCYSIKIWMCASRPVLVIWLKGLTIMDSKTKMNTSMFKDNKYAIQYGNYKY